MGDHDDALAEFVDAGAQDVQHPAGGPGVEVAGGLVGEDDGGPPDQGAGAGHALGLPAGQLGGAVVQAVAQADGVDDPVEVVAVDPPAGDVQGQGDVLLRAQGGHQVEGLEDEADVLAAQPGESAPAHGRDLLPVERDRPGGGRLQARQAVHEGGLARAGGAHDGGEAPAREVHVDGVERGDGALAAAEDLGQGAGGDHRVVDGAVRRQSRRFAAARARVPPRRHLRAAVVCVCRHGRSLSRDSPAPHRGRRAAGRTGSRRAARGAPPFG